MNRNEIHSAIFLLRKAMVILAAEKNPNFKEASAFLKKSVDYLKEIPKH